MMVLTAIFPASPTAFAEKMARAVGFEPTTNRLTADCSTAELRPNSQMRPVDREGAYLVAHARRVNL